MSKLLFPTSVVGSMPRSQFVLDLINDRPPLAAERYLQSSEERDPECDAAEYSGKKRGRCAAYLVQNVGGDIVAREQSASAAHP